MKRKLIFLGAAGLVVCVGVGIGIYISRDRTEQTSPPNHYPLQAAPVRLPSIEEWDIGTTTPGKVLTRAFAIKNTSEQTWTVKHVRVVCGCADVKPRAKTIAPGETGWVDVTFQAPRYAGAVGGTILVEFVEPDSRVFQLTLKAEVRGLITARPTRLEFDDTSAGPTAAQTVKLAASGEPRVRITRVEAPAGVRTDLRPAAGAAAGQEWDLVVYPETTRLAATAAALEVVVHTEPLEAGLVRIPLTLKPALRALPNAVDFGVVPVNVAQTRKVILEAAEPLTTKDVVIEHDLGDTVEVRAEPAAGGKTVVLTVALRPPPPNSKIEGVVRVALRGRPGAPALVVVKAETRRVR